ncbi:MAG TPA: PAS domain S-box protein, partial [Gemmatimonadales bacterium]|nr:PAS domain S-box protein [Gemmatimonadales bacterium]
LPNVPPELQGEFQRQLAHQADAVSDHETVRRRKDGTELEVSLTTWPLYDDGGRLIGVMGAQQDITERKRSERLQRATYRISQAALASPDLNQLFAAIHAIVSELMPARNLYLAVYDPASDTISFPYWVDELDPRPEPRRARKGLTEYVIRTGRPLRDRPAFIGSLVARGEVESFGSNSTDWLGVPLKVAGRAFGVLAVQSYDPGVRYSEREETILEFVSSQVAMAVDRKQAEAALRQSEERFRVVASTTNDALWEWDARRERDWMSDSVQQILGYSPTEFRIGRAAGWEALVHPEDHDRVVHGLRGAVEGNATSWRAEYRIRRRDGTHAYVFDRARILRDAGDGTVRVLGAMMDVSERREAEEALQRSEEQLRQAMKMEAVGRLAGGVAHDFNNLLTSVLGHADLALAALSLSDPLREDLLEIRSAGTRAAGLTQQLLAFSRKQVLEPRVVDLNAVVSGLARMLRRTIGEDIALVTRLAPDLNPVRADPVQMEQVLLNLAVNARDAMPDGGRLTIETRNVLLPSGPAARVTVEDTGVGMSEDVRTHLFEPFFTTKEIGKGTGLGLATVYGIVQQSGGSIAVTSTPGQGTTFVVDLPHAVGAPVPTER